MLILVVAVLVLLALIGTAYVQQSRFDRYSSDVLNDRDIDQVANATIARIQTLLYEDLYGETGSGFLDGQTGNEPYDYPHHQRDPWLASTTPDFTGAPTWPHVTELVSSGGSEELNDLGLSISSNVNVWTGGAVNAGQKADADGDGVADSVWIRAPLPGVRGKRYIAAVRIVDLSAMANINVALRSTEWSAVGSAPSYALTDDSPGVWPRWRYPVDLDLPQFFYDITQRIGGPTQALTELDALLDGRTDLDVALAGEFLDVDQKQNFFDAAARRIINPTGDYTTFGVNDELELRYRGGLNHPGVEAHVDSLMPRLFRDRNWNNNSSADSEDSYSDNFASVQAFFEGNPRLAMTVLSGATVAAPKTTGGGAGNDPLWQVDINVATLDDIAEVVRDVYTGGGPAYPLGITNPNEMANQFAASLADYRDEDNLLTKYPETGAGRYGFEALPMLGEVYAQRAYEITMITKPGPPTWNIRCDERGNPGYAIELRNPHNYQISLDNVYLYIDGANWGELSSAALANQATLGPEEILILYRDSGSGGNGGHDDLTTLWSAGNINITAVAITGDWPTSPNNSQDISVELYATASDSPGSPMSFAYQQVPGKTIPDRVDDVMDSTVDPTGQFVYEQRVALGNANGLNMLTVLETDWLENGSGVGTDFSEIDKLGEDAKGGPAGYGLDNTLHQFVLRNDVDGKIWHIGELASMAVFGLQNNQTLAEAWQSSGALEVNDLRLSFDPANLVDDAGQSAEKVPHAVWLLSRFTTHSPLSDIADNDGDGSADNQEEAMVYGRINLNTAPRTTIQALLPLADPVTRDDLATAIEDYRDDVAARDPALTARTSDPDDVGFAHVGELLTIEAFQALATDAAFAGDTRDVGGVDVDFTYDIGLGADGVVDDAEERYMLGKLVGQMATVRSDTFAAYVVIRGYRSDDDDFVESELVEQRRFVVLLDRSSVIDVDGRVRVLGVMDH